MEGPTPLDISFQMTVNLLDLLISDEGNLTPMEVTLVEGLRGEYLDAVDVFYADLAKGVRNGSGFERYIVVSEAISALAQVFMRRGLEKP